MRLKNSDWLMIVVVGAAVLLFMAWVILPNKANTQFIDTQSIQIDTSN